MLLFYLHIFFMALGVVCFFISLFMVMNRKKFKGTWLPRHRRFNQAGLFSMLIGFIIIFLYVQSYGGTHFLILHSRFGLITLLLLTMTLTFMLWSMKYKKNKFMKFHPWSGRISLTLLLVTLVLGLLLII